MIRKLGKDAIPLLREKLQQEKELNLFFLNNLETQTYGKDYHLYGGDHIWFMNWKELSVLVYADGPYDREEAVAWLKTQKFSGLNSARSYTEPLIEGLSEDFDLTVSELMYVDSSTFRKLPQRSDNLRLLLAPEDFEKVGHLYATSPYFGEDLQTEEEIEDWAWAMAEREYPFAASGYFVKKKLVGCAYLSAYTRHSAMVVGVYVHPDYENGGIGTQVVSELTDLALNENRIGCLCLFYSSPKAKHIYEKLGYRVVGDYCYFRRK